MRGVTRVLVGERVIAGVLAVAAFLAGRCFRVVDLLCSLHVFEEQHNPSDHEVL